MSLTPSGPLAAVTGHRAHVLAHVWKIVREDAVTLRFTDHDTPVTFDDGGGNATYTPVGAPSTSALRREAGLGEQERSAEGAITSDQITDDDLAAGLYRGAELTEWLIDPRFPWAGSFYQTIHWIEGVEFDGEAWQCEMVGVNSWLTQRTGRLFTRTCTAEPFDDRCGLLTSDEAWYEVTNVQPLAGSFDSVEPRRKFALTFGSLSDPGISETEYRYGTLTWTTGPNAGVVSEIKEYGHTSTGGQRDIELMLPTPYEISDTDRGTIRTGCDRTASTCETKFDNLDNHRGFPTMPTEDDVLRTPDVPA